MPDSAISTGLIDFAVPVEKMGETLELVVRGRPILNALVSREDTDRLRRAQDEISQLLRSHSGHDFSGYKSKTFLVRVARRMQVV